MRPELEKKVQQAIRLLQMTAPADGSPVEVGYSGGKDSDVILQLVKESGIPYRAIYRSTTIDPPGTIKHVEQMGVEIRQPKMTFKHLIEKKGMPSRLHRFCCEVLKEYKILDKLVVGVRRDESTSRAERYTEPTACRIYGKDEHQEQILPILTWTTEDVKDFLEDRGIKCAPVYYDNNGCFHPERRLGCMCCPMASHKKRLEEFKQWPGMVKLYVRACQKFLDTHPDSKSAKAHDDAYEYFTHYVFYPDEKWQVIRDGLFGKPDCKAFLENYFKISLDAPAHQG